MAERIPAPSLGDEVSWVRRHLGDLLDGEPTVPPIRGGQAAADAALSGFDVSGYATRRNEVWPSGRRGASRLSPYIRHGLIPLRRAWDAVRGGPGKDVTKFRDELLWQEYARHLYARLGASTGSSLRFEVPGGVGSGAAWPEGMVCVDEAVGELTSGWLTNQQRMWLASQWTVRDGWDWRAGEDTFFRHLLDGSRAANRTGWQWTVGALTGKAYGFSRWQVEKRAPGLCGRCPLARECPIDEWPDERELRPRGDVDPRLRRDPDLSATAGPRERAGSDEPSAVWMTAESLGDDDPALRAHPALPAVFVWDLPLLSRLRLAPGRLIFLAQCLADLADRREVEVLVGDPVATLQGRALAATFTPVPGWRRRSAYLSLAVTYPWPWLLRPHEGPLTSFTAWRRTTGA